MDARSSQPTIDAASAEARDLYLHGRVPEAEQHCRSILATEPRNFHARHLLGITLIQQQQFAEAERQIAHALEIEPSVAAAHSNRGNALQALGRFDEAVLSYDKAITLDPGFAGAFNNRGNALQGLGRFDDALASYDKAIALDPTTPRTFFNRGNVLQRLKRFEEALVGYEKAIELKPDYLDAIIERASVLLERKSFVEALGEYEKALSVAPGDARAMCGILQCRLQICDWAALDTIKKDIPEAIRAGARYVSPGQHRAMFDLEEENLFNVRLWCPPPAAASWRGNGRYGHKRIRLAYLSADFRRHATSFLMAGVFALHDRRRFELVAISNDSDASELGAHVASAFDQFIDVRNMRASDIAKLIQAGEIDIAVDLNGHTQNNQLDVLAFRPAPIQVNYLGYPGTSGAGYLDYVIADRFVIPEENQRYYAEKVVYLPETYQANTERRVADAVQSREQAGLPDSGFVFCSFNNNYKITREVFDIWMGLLRRVDGSVLWLLEDNEHAATNLRREAWARSIDPERLIYAPRIEPAHHLARHRLADLFLDTLPYNAHTTASDALWMGLPIVTCMGRSFQARVAASLLNAIGLPEMVTDTLEGYGNLSLALARDKGQLAAIKSKLAAHRDMHPLFDTVRFTRNLESAFIEMWRRHEEGLPPENFSVQETAAES